MRALRTFTSTLLCLLHRYLVFFFFNDTATTEIYTLSLHDALPICLHGSVAGAVAPGPLERRPVCPKPGRRRGVGAIRSEEHTSELQSQSNLVCRLLLEKKKKKQSHRTSLSTTPDPRKP